MSNPANSSSSLVKQNFLGQNCIGVFIRSFEITNYYFNFIDIIHFHDLFSHSLKASGRGRLHYLLAGDEGLVALVRDALEDDGKGDSGARRILLPIVCKIKDSQLQIFIHKRLSYDYIRV